MHICLSLPMLHHSEFPILLPPLRFTPHPPNQRDFHDTCPPPTALACAEPACVAMPDCGVFCECLPFLHIIQLLPSPIGIAPPPTGQYGESIPIPLPFMLQLHPSEHAPILPRPRGAT
ncbi:hypothetical protein JB92DRAFT_3055420 [Gautieria morchelliformis]|nr:hypothetical protein JB92DRAFT_3055420 [Gautieria morchelliformis]